MLVARYTLRAHRAAWLLGAGEDADDVVQEAFVKAFRSLPKFRAGEPFAPWLLSIVANETKNLLRSRHRRNALALRLSALEPDSATPDTPFDEAAASEQLTHAFERPARNSLSPSARAGALAASQRPNAMATAARRRLIVALYFPTKVARI